MGGLTCLGGRNAPGFGASAEERASRGPHYIVRTATGHDNSPVEMAGLLVGTAGPGRFRAMSVVAKAGDELMEADDSDLDKVMEYIRKRQGPIDSILKEIHDFKHDVAMPASFAQVCGDEDMLQMFALKMKGCGTILETSLELRSPTPINREALIMIGKDLKMAALEYEEGLETLDRVVASLKILRVTSLGCPEDYLEPLNTCMSTPPLRVKVTSLEPLNTCMSTPPLRVK